MIKTLLALMTILGLSSTPLVFGQVQSDLGIINDLILDNKKWYYFETDKDIKSSTWIADTRIKVSNGVDIQNLSEERFIYPTEMTQDRENLYFAALSGDCTGKTSCDYQDLYKISKTDGSLLVLAKNLRSSIHLSMEDNFVYVSESSGNIWKIAKTDESKKLVVKANEIVMDVVTNGNKVYWIEEISDQNSSVLTLENEQPKIIAKNLKIPYDLTVQKNRLFWNEIQVKPHDVGFSEFTAIKSHDGAYSMLMEFQNTSPISTALNELNYGPYLVFDDYLFLVNNTNDQSVIHMINLYNSTKYDVGVISGYDAKYLRTDGQSLFVIGINQDGFIIDRHSLPMVVPEFPNVILAIMPIALISAVILSRFSHSLSR